MTLFFLQNDDQNWGIGTFGTFIYDPNSTIILGSTRNFQSLLGITNRLWTPIYFFLSNFQTDLRTSNCPKIQNSKRPKNSAKMKREISQVNFSLFKEKVSQIGWDIVLFVLNSSNMIWLSHFLVSQRFFWRSG